VNPRASPDDVEKRKFLTLLGLKLRPLSRPARSQSLYRLLYPGSLHGVVLNKLSAGTLPFLTSSAPNPWKAGLTAIIGESPAL
jgi:hypothetical protein